jgi:regulator of PEP synthase PpsR (kinase-PPPase family)
LEERLLPLNFRLVFCTRSPDSFAAAREERLKVSGNPSQYNDLDQFKLEQEVLEELVSHSLLPVLRLDISDNDVPKAAETIVDWMAATGGLEMPE